jgi:hypothetical protein
VRAELGPVLAVVLLIAVGFAFLLAGGLIEHGWRKYVAVLGLAFLTGCAAVGIVEIFLLVIGVPISAAEIAGLCLLLTAVALTRAWQLGRFPALAWSGRSFERTTWGVRVWILLFAIIALSGTYEAVQKPLTDWDSWDIWMPHALYLTYFSHLQKGLLTEHVLIGTHQGYPILLPVLEAMWFRFAGIANTTSIHLLPWLMLVGLAWSLAYLLARRTSVGVWGPIVLLILVVPSVWSQDLTAYADIPMAGFLAIGALLLGSWLVDRRAPLWLAALMLGAAANTKSEGLIFAILAVAASAVTAGDYRRRLIPLAYAGAGVVGAALPWLLWTIVEGVPRDPDLGSQNFTRLGYLFDHFDRVTTSARTLAGNLGSVWSYVAVLGLALALICAWRGVARRAAVFYLVACLAAFAAMLVIYWTSSDALSWYLSTSSHRSVDGMAFIAFAAICHLTTELAARLEQRPPASQKH